MQRCKLASHQKFGEKSSNLTELRQTLLKGYAFACEGFAIESEVRNGRRVGLHDPKSHAQDLKY